MKSRLAGVLSVCLGSFFGLSIGTVQAVPLPAVADAEIEVDFTLEILGGVFGQDTVGGMLGEFLPTVESTTGDATSFALGSNTPCTSISTLCSFGGGGFVSAEATDGTAIASASVINTPVKFTLTGTRSIMVSRSDLLPLSETSSNGMDPAGSAATSVEIFGFT